MVEFSAIGWGFLALAVLAVVFLIAALVRLWRMRPDPTVEAVPAPAVPVDEPPAPEPQVAPDLPPAEGEERER